MLNDKALASGLRAGIIIGIFIGFFRSQQIKGFFGGSSASAFRSQLDNLISDPVAQGLEEGKAAAHRHLRENRSG